MPYDTGNFEFSNKRGLREVDQSKSIYHLNQNVLNANPTPAEQNLIAAWYLSGFTLDKNYEPDSWHQAGLNVGDYDSVYRDYVARSCRTCHVALPAYNFDDQGNFFGANTVCGQGSPDSLNPDLLRSHSMPNSLVTFNRFWLSATSHDHSAAPVDQVELMNIWEGWPTPPGPSLCVRGWTP